MKQGEPLDPVELKRMRMSEVTWGDIAETHIDIPASVLPAEFTSATKLAVRVTDVSRAWAVRISARCLTALAAGDILLPVFEIHAGIGKARFVQQRGIAGMNGPLPAGFENTVFLPDYPAETLDITAVVTIQAGPGALRSIDVRLNAAAAPYTRLREDQ